MPWAETVPTSPEIRAGTVISAMDGTRDQVLRTRWTGQSLRRFEKGYVDALMRACDSNISAAARKAGMDRSNFKRVLRKYRQDVDGEGGDDTGDEQERMVS